MTETPGSNGLEFGMVATGQRVRHLCRYPADGRLGIADDRSFLRICHADCGRNWGAGRRGDTSAPPDHSRIGSFSRPAGRASEEDHDRFTGAIIRRGNGTGEVFFAGTNWRGGARRVSVLNWQASEADIALAVARSGYG